MARRTTQVEDVVKTYYKAVRSQDFPMWAIVTCPRCSEKFLVKIKEWIAPRKAPTDRDVTVRGKSCPYCQMTAFPPERKEIKRGRI